MKGKFRFSLLVMIISLVFVACSSQKNAGHEDLTQLLGNIGKPKDEVFENLNLEEGTDIELYKEGIFVFQDEKKLYGEPFTLFLNFDLMNGKLYELSYRRVFDDFDKSVYDLTSKLLEGLNHSYGEPATYPGLPNIISNIKDFEEFEELTAQKNNDYLETWEIDDGMEVILRTSLARQENEKNVITVNYKIITSSEEW